jgi:hypothetical protein
VSAALIESRGARAVSTSSQPPSVVKPTPWKPARQTGERRHAGRHRDVRPTRHNVEPSERHARTGWAASPETPRASILSSLGCRSPRRGLTPALLMRGPIRRRRRRGGPWSAARPGRGQPSNHVQLPQRSEGVEWPREDRAATSASTPEGVRDQLEAIKNREQYHQPDSLAAATSSIADALAG